MECSCNTKAALRDLWKASYDLWRLRNTSAHSWLSIKELLSQGIQGAWNLMREKEYTMRDDKEMRLFLTQTHQNLCVLMFWSSQASAKAHYPCCQKHSLKLFPSAHHPDTLSNTDYPWEFSQNLSSSKCLPQLLPSSLYCCACNPIHPSSSNPMSHRISLTSKLL